MGSRGSSSTTGYQRFADIQASSLGVLTGDEEQALVKYSHGYDGKINKALRTGTSLADLRSRDPVTAHYERNLASVMERSVLSRNVITYKGMWDVSGDIRAKMVKGATIEDKGYASTSLSKEVAKGFGSHVTVVIRARKGQKALSLTNHSDWGFEHEVLYPKGSKFKISHVKKAANGGSIVYADLI